jgi:hypothetical protein
MVDTAGYLALGTLDSTGTVFTELSALQAPNYTRQAVTFEPLGEFLRNKADVVFGRTNMRWPQFSAYALFSAASGGTQLMAWAVAARSVPQDGRFAIDEGEIRLEFPVARSNHGSPIILGAPFLLSPQRLFPQLFVTEISQAAYDALPVKDPLTLYVIAA